MSNKEYRPTLAQIRTFVTIAERRHFGTAANQLQISQPSLSQALVALESGLGIQLIERSTRKVIVTPVGERLLPYAQATLEAADSFVQHSRGAQGVLTGQLTLGIIPTIAPYLLPELLRAAQERYPDLEPKIVEETTPALMDQLRNGQLDAALIAFPTGTTGLDEIPLYTEDFAIAVAEGHPMAGRDDVTLSELDALDMLLMDDGHCLRDQIMDLCRNANLDVAGMTESVTRASSLTTIIQLVAAGYGGTLLPISAVSVECARPNVAVAHFADSVTASRHVGLVHRSSSTRADEFAALGELITEAFHATVDKRA
ncbi:transcriptional regulator [Corynebacterium appendicis CIP 107643]|uniref:Probable hydrogen peroxide-inducible genes activator n=1 Tax=Corynebacterium appendicis CIP 107643 TaxID=1161099 RepID=A0A1N7J3V8_9CORY|nr:hydrogen peroxide-inducible genes activator [Corynebacterium appendicis]WJY61307.1 putative hydrogen peroxide-inducible genes activator [Corynebacterium appendicis CIP 107643]SIS43901.1 transcriptional regulator [Corynebacterium appendicis CIP 107643]